MKSSRRDFLKTTSATIAGAIIAPRVLAGAVPVRSGSTSFCVFTKCLQFLDFDHLGETLAEAGFDGADLAVRPGGQVLPEKVKTDLPKAVKALKKSGISVPMMVTAISDPDNPLTEAVIATAADQGLTHYRTGYLSYDPKISIAENLDKHKSTVEKLEKLNRKYKIHGGYQNHSGTRVGGPVWDLYWLLKDLDPEYMGVQYDIRHAIVEGAESWSVGMRLLAPWIRTTAIKDFYWKKENGRWIILNVPLGEGMVNFDAYFRNFVNLGIPAAPVTIHYEYDLGGAEHGRLETKMPLADIKVFLKQDLVWLRKKYKDFEIS
jgi:sugar phosphate isomerase/epimerase